jgi:menaquinone-specific isochorismate synthase
VTAERPLVARTWRLDGEVDLLAVAGPEGQIWESAGLSLAGRGEAVRLVVAGGVSGRAATARKLAEVLSAMTIEGEPGAPGPLALTALPFDPDHEGTVVVPALQVRRSADGARWATVVGDAESLPATPPQLVDGSRPWPQPTCYYVRTADRPEHWMKCVEAGRDEVRAGRLRKVVLARVVDVEADVELDQTVVLRRLRGTYPTCLRFGVDGFVGASPELLVARQGDIVRAQPMAGTAPRLGDPAADARLAAGLLASEKDRTEHQVTIDEVETALLPFCSYLDALAQPEVVAVANVQHLATLVEGRLSRPLPSVLELVAALHPTPAVGGDPRSEALKLIARLEPHGRGRYAGPVGWIDAAGNGEFAVGIRSAELHGARARVYAGVGVVADSDPQAEFAETQAKFQAMLGALIRP